MRLRTTRIHWHCIFAFLTDHSVIKTEINTYFWTFYSPAIRRFSSDLHNVSAQHTPVLPYISRLFAITNFLLFFFYISNLLRISRPTLANCLFRHETLSSSCWSRYSLLVRFAPQSSMHSSLHHPYSYQSLHSPLPCSKF